MRFFAEDPILIAFSRHPSFSSLGCVELSINDMFDKTGELFTYELGLSHAQRETNSQGIIKFSAGYFQAHDISKGSRRAPAGTTIKLKVDGVGAPLVENPGSERRAGNCRYTS